MEKTYRELVDRLPVRAAVYRADALGDERPMVVFDRIEANAPHPVGLFSFNTPQGYRAEQRARPVQPPRRASATVGDASLAVWFTFAINNSAVLVCWKMDTNGAADPGGAADDRVTPTIRIVSERGRRGCEEEKSAPVLP